MLLHICRPNNSEQLEVACLFSASTHAPAAAPKQKSFEGKQKLQAGHVIFSSAGKFYAEYEIRLACAMSDSSNFGLRPLLPALPAAACLWKEQIL